ncbi:MAG: hypothetical protein EOO20_29110 [Chryseobacterium sp.]|nr:MAG: hypothetical protein EOO20_29110 [Chryseobacterium sp.]
MEIFDSSEYVMERAKSIAPYFAKRGWFVTCGKSNSILINIPGHQEFNYNKIELADILAQSDFSCQPTGLKMTVVTYMFFQHLKLVKSFDVLPGQEFDV